MSRTKLTLDEANALWEQYSMAQAVLYEAVESDGYIPESKDFDRVLLVRERELRKQFPWDEMVDAIGG